jgi:dipeptidyl aminopeptidase/acylaminoacyl peptidase
MFRLRLLRGGILSAALSLFVSGLVAGEPAKRPLTPQDFDGWRSLDTPVLSRDGRWLAYADMPQVDDGHLVVRELGSGRELREPAGARPPAPFPPPRAANPEDPPPARDLQIRLTSDSRFAVASTFPLRADLVAARKQKKKPDDMPKNGLLLLNLATGESVRIARVKSFQVPARGGAWVAYLKETEPAAKDAPAAEKPDEKPAEEPVAPVADQPAATPEAKPAPKTSAVAATEPAATEPAAPAGKPAKKKPTYGTDLVLRDLATGAERIFPDVVEYTFARDGHTLLYTVSAQKSAANGVYAVTPGDPAAPVALLSGSGRYLKLAWDRQQTQATFLSDRDDVAAEVPQFKAYHVIRGVSGTTELKFTAPAGLVLSDKAGPAFSRDGRKLYLGLAPAPKPEPEADAALDPEDKVTADLWSWHDDYVQPMQEVRATLERNRTYRGVLDLATGAYTQLADASLPAVTLSDDGTRGLGFDDRAYRRRVDYDGTYSDIYLVNPTTGERRLVLSELRGGSGNRGNPSLAWSPDGRWAAYFDAGHWHVLDTATGTTRNLTHGLPVSFAREDHDTPEPTPSYSWAGWTSDSSSLLVYDQFDVWRLFPDGQAAVNVTQGTGRADKIALRVLNIEPREEDDEERGLDPARPLTLRGESEETRATGFFRTTLEATTAPQRLLWGDKNHSYAGRALEADVLLVTVSRFNEFPDVHTTTAEFGTLTKVTDLGAQLAPLAWGTAELVNFTNADGVPLQALLYKPPGFDPAKKYPLIVYLYEQLSQNVHRFFPPAPGTSINFPHYVSNGYLLLMPDIVYTEGEPGPSALKCVLPAVDAVAAQGFVDEAAIGIQGHSWGGYQIAYMLTQTNRFRAAEAGAPVGNMTSAYGGIRWGPGLPRLFQYENTQSRIGPPLTDAPERYVANSPVFHIKNVQTPLLILHNDQDDAVPWEQGIELFLALRRHGKTAWFFNYNRELHGLRRRADQQDFTLRMWQFFDHYLRGAPAPEWMTQGIPYLDRDAEKLRFNARPE